MTVIKFSKTLQYNQSFELRVVFLIFFYKFFIYTVFYRKRGKSFEGLSIDPLLFLVISKSQKT